MTQDITVVTTYLISMMYKMQTAYQHSEEVRTQNWSDNR